jgi:hypothetical protein
MDAQSGAGTAFHLTVESEHFRRAAGLFEQWLPRNQWKSRCGLWLHGSELVMRIGNDEAAIPASGTWPPAVLTSANWLIVESSRWPGTGQIELSVADDRLRVRTETGSRTHACTVEPVRPSWPRCVEQLAPFTMLEILLLPQRFAEQSIEYSGLAEELARCVAKIRQVVDSLTDSIHDAAETHELDPGQVREVFDYLVGPGLEELQRRKS